MKTTDSKFWQIIKANWTLDERAELSAHVEAWIASRGSCDFLNGNVPRRGGPRLIDR
jgi:hypothetical protein